MSLQLEPVLRQLSQLHFLATFSPQTHFILPSNLHLDLQSGIFLYVFRLLICAFVNLTRRSACPSLFENVIPITDDGVCFVHAIKIYGEMEIKPHAFFISALHGDEW
jgi:hypothetical protein